MIPRKKSADHFTEGAREDSGSAMVSSGLRRLPRLRDAPLDARSEAATIISTSLIIQRRKPCQYRDRWFGKSVIVSGTNAPCRWYFKGSPEPLPIKRLLA